MCVCVRVCVCMCVFVCLYVWSRVGGEQVGINPKINNMVPGYRKAQHQLLWICDSNIKSNLLQKALPTLLLKICYKFVANCFLETMTRIL